MANQGLTQTSIMEAPAVAGEQVRYDMDQGYPQGYTQQEVEGKYNTYISEYFYLISQKI